MLNPSQRNSQVRMTKVQKNISVLLGIDMNPSQDDFWTSNKKLEKRVTNPSISRKVLGRTDKKPRRIIVK